MSKSTSRNIYLIGLVIIVVGTILLFISIPGGQTTVTDSGGTITTPGNPALLAISSAVFIIAGLICFVAWVGALIKMAQLRQWMWFVLLLVASGITMLIYIFAGPTTSADAQMYPSNPQYPLNPQYPPYPVQSSNQDYQPYPPNQPGPYSPGQPYPPNQPYAQNHPDQPYQPYPQNPPYPPQDYPRQ